MLWRLSRGYRLRPWKSPYLRWRIETYSGLHADRISFADFWKFTWKERRNLARYLRWADSFSAQQPAVRAHDDVGRSSSSAAGPPGPPAR